MQIDIGFGDVMTPGSERLTYPVLLNFPPPVLSGYSRETVIAEKLQAIAQLGMLNTRMKDYFDLWLLLRQLSFDEQVLKSAIQRTFKNRQTIIEAEFVGLSDAFGNDPAKRAQWIAFLQRGSLSDTPNDLSDVVLEIRSALRSVLQGA